MQICKVCPRKEICQKKKIESFTKECLAQIDNELIRLKRLKRDVLISLKDDFIASEKPDDKILPSEFFSTLNKAEEMSENLLVLFPQEACRVIPKMGDILTNVILAIMFNWEIANKIRNKNQIAKEQTKL